MVLLLLFLLELRRELPEKLLLEEEEQEMRYAKTSLSSGERAAARVRMVAGRKESWSEIIGGDG